MEAVTANTAAGGGVGTGSKTIADLLPMAVERHGAAPAQRHKVGESWVDISYAELGTIVREISLGLVDLGIEPGDKVAILANTRTEWTHACFGILTAGGALVTVYQTNSAEECQYVLGHSDSKAVFVEDAAQLAKVREIRSECPALNHVVVMDPAGVELDDELALDALRERGRARDEAEWRRRYEAVGPDDICLFIYTSGTTGPPKGCLLSHGNYRSITDAAVKNSVLDDGDSAYLFLPLAHAFAILIQFVVFDLGTTLAYWSRDPKQIIADLSQVQPTYFPSVPRIFEKIYTMATSVAPDREKLDQAVEVGVKVRLAQAAGQEVPAELQTAFDASEEALYKNVRALFGGRIRECVTGAAPIAPEILRFFYACGVPVMEGYGMTETATSATVNRTTDDGFRFGSVGKPLDGVEVRIAEDGEVWSRARTSSRATTRTTPPRIGLGGPLASHRRPRPARRGRLSPHHRAQEGHHHHRRGQEHHARQPGERAEAEPLGLPGGGGGGPPAFSGGSPHARRGGGAGPGGAGRREGADVAALAHDERVRAEDPENRGRGELSRRSG